MFFWRTKTTEYPYDLDEIAASSTGMETQDIFDEEPYDAFDHVIYKNDIGACTECRGLFWTWDLQYIFVENAPPEFPSPPKHSPEPRFYCPQDEKPYQRVVIADDGSETYWVRQDLWKEVEKPKRHVKIARKDK